MKEVFQITGISTKTSKDEDIVFTVTMKTQVSPGYAGTLQQKLSPYAYRYCIVNLEKQQAEIDADTGEVA